MMIVMLYTSVYPLDKREHQKKCSSATRGCVRGEVRIE